jgi:hypothetical protein
MNALKLVILSATLFVGLSTMGCQTSHTESDRTGVLGGHTHEETTVTKNPITGDTSVEHTKTQTPP